MSGATKPLLETSNLSVHYGSVAALNGAGLALEKGSFVICTGPSGSGKSTLAAALLGALPRNASVTGSIRLDHGRIAGVGQEPSAGLHPMRRIGLQIADVLAAHGKPPGQAAELLAAAGIASHARSYPFQLSSGQAQRAAILRAIAMNPVLLVADEATASLDPGGEWDILQFLLRIRSERDMAILWITHRPDAAAPFATHWWRMEGGRLTASAPPASQPVVAPAARGEGTRGEGDGEPRARARNLRKSYDRCVLDGVDVDLRAGRTIALRGRSGCGKSTLGRILAGIEAPDHGTVERTTTIQYVWPDAATALNPRWRAVDAVAEPLTIGGAGKAERQARASYWLERLGLPKVAVRRRVSELSGGERRRVLIARALIAGPGALVFDEATNGLDPANRSALIEVLRALQPELGLAYLWITHDSESVEGFAHDMAHLEGGTVRFA